MRRTQMQRFGATLEKVQPTARKMRTPKVETLFWGQVYIDELPVEPGVAALTAALINKSEEMREEQERRRLREAQRRALEQQYGLSGGAW